MSNVWQDMRDASAWGAWKKANDRLNGGGELSEQEKSYLTGVKKNAVASGIMSAAQGVNGILNPALQAAQIGDTTMYQYDIANVAELGTGPYYDWDQLGGDYANANLNIKPIDTDDVRGMSTKEKWGAGVTGALAGAQAGMAIGGPWGALAGGVLGAGAAAIGILSGNRKAEREAMSLNNQADIAQQYAKQNFGAAFERVADRQNRIGQSNIAAEGGKMSKAAKSKHMTIQQFADSVLSKQNADKHMDMIKKHSFSAGGKTYNTHGGYFSPDLIKIEAGGTHEQNPFGGIQLGVDPMGVPNLVEEGEIIHEDYVFSDRLNASESLLKEFALPMKYAGKSFAYIADKLSSESKERPNDSVSNSGLEMMYDRLMAAQDAHKAKLEEAKLKREMKKMSPEELGAMTQALAMQAAPVEEQAMQQPEMMPIGQEPVVAAKGGRLAHMYGWGRDANGNLVWVPDTDSKYKLSVSRPAVLDINLGSYQYLPPPKPETWVPENPTYDNNWSNNDWLLDDTAQDFAWDRGIHKEIDPTGSQANTGNIDWHSAGVAAKNAGENSFQWRGKTYSVSDLGEPLAAQRVQQPTRPSASSKSAIDMENDANYINLMNELASHADKDGNLDAMGKALLYRLNKAKGDGDKTYQDWLNNIKDQKPGSYHNAFYNVANELAQERLADEYKNIVRDVPDEPEYVNVEPFDFDDNLTAKPMTIDEATGRVGAQDSMSHLPTWQRYAGAGYNAISMLHNMLQEPDRYQARRLTPSLTYGDLALDRLSYTPYDFNLAANQLTAADAATRSQIANSGMGPSTGATLLAQNYNAGRNLGNAYWQTQLANQQQKANVIAANNQAAQAEADFDYRRDLGNTQIRNQYGLYNLQNAMQTDMLNKQAESQKWQAVSQAGDAFAQDLTNIGRENFNMNMVNSNPALFYFIDPSTGMVDYKKWAAYNEMQKQNQEV